MRSFLLMAFVAAVVLTGCTPGSGHSNSLSSRACVILPEEGRFARWTQYDRPALVTAAKNAGFQLEIRNAEGDADTYADLGTELLSEGCGVMILADLAGAAAGVAAEAKGKGVPVIAYDRPIQGADYLVSFDYAEIGRIQARALVSALTDSGIAAGDAMVYYVGGDAADANTEITRTAALDELTAAGIAHLAEIPRQTTPEGLSLAFAETLDVNKNRVHAVWAANDAMAIATVSVLDSRALRAAVVGQDATTEGLRYVLLGKQVATVSKSYREEANAAANAAVSLLFGDAPRATGALEDGTPFIQVDAQLITAADVAELIDGGSISAKDICWGAVADVCAAHGIR